MDKNLWNKCVEFHGHQCPGLAIGFRASEIAMDLLNVDFSKDEEILCITENDACGVDAVQVITGCTFGKGNLIYKPTGKMGFTFINRTNNQSYRLVLKPIAKDMTKEERQEYILTGPREELYKIEQVKIDIPERARIFQTIICEKCNEGAPEHKIRLQEGKKLCLDCVDQYSRRI